MRLLRTAALVYAAAFLLPAAAQTPAQTPAPTPAEQRAEPAGRPPQRRDDASADAPVEDDLSITARVTARELLFRKVPNPRVEFPGRPERRTLWEAERENLSRESYPGMTYRDIGIRLRITSVFADIDRIVAEALGEVPARDAATPQPQPSPQPQQPSPTAPPAPASPPERSAPPALDPSPVSQTSPANALSQTPTRAARPRGARRGTIN